MLNILQMLDHMLDAWVSFVSTMSFGFGYAQTRSGANLFWRQSNTSPSVSDNPCCYY